MQVKLSARLTAVANMIPKCRSFADIGTDHAFLPIYSVQNKISNYVIAGDIAEQPCEQGRRQVERYDLKDKVEVRCGAGLQVIRPSEVDGVAIAGLGGGTMVQILDANPVVVDKLEFLVLQPQSDYAYVRDWLQKNDWYIDDETIVIENNITYQIIRAMRGEMEILSRFEAFYGPLNIKHASSELINFLKNDLIHHQKIYTEMSQSTNSKLSSRLIETQNWIDLLTAKIECLESIHLNKKITQ